MSRFATLPRAYRRQLQAADQQAGVYERHGWGCASRRQRALDQVLREIRPLLGSEDPA